MLYLTNILKVLLNMNLKVKKVQSPLTNNVVYDLQSFFKRKLFLMLKVYK